MEHVELSGIIIDVDSVTLDKRTAIRVTLKAKDGVHSLIDNKVHPYLNLIPSNPNLDPKTLERMEFPTTEGEIIKIVGVKKIDTSLRGVKLTVFRVEIEHSRHVPKLKDYLREFGECYEYDILFWKRYLIDNNISPLIGIKVKAHRDGDNLLLDEIKNDGPGDTKLTHLCFDIETYNPHGIPRPKIDPAIMISYADDEQRGVIAAKKVGADFVQTVKSEAELINSFADVVTKKDPDIIVGYNSSNFDVPYLLDRAQSQGTVLALSRYGEQVKKDPHGLVDMVKIPGRINLDIYHVVKFVSVVGASEKLIRVNSFRLVEVYEAVTGGKKKMVDKPNIWQLWDGGAKELKELAEYSLDDSIALNELYNFFVPLEIEISKIVGTTLGETSVSTTGQLVEYLLMRNARQNNELINNKPGAEEIERRLENPIEGAYVKTPEAGIYENIVVLDFRGLYPSIIVAHNIDPSTIVSTAEQVPYYESPLGVKFRKDPIGITPKVLRYLISERAEVKKAYKKDPDNLALGARSQALKILANSFYGYLGYARSRWYSRDCAGSVTAFGREYIKKTMDEAEKSGFKVLYGDTDSIFLLKGEKSKDDVLAFLKKLNATLPESMELELEDFYTRGVFVGKRGAEGGAKKKYALLSENGRVKIKGFELVRRDWSKVARDTQKAVLEAILKEGSKERAVQIVRDVVKQLRDGNVPLRDLAIQTQLRKKLSEYDIMSPEVSAARKAIQSGKRKKEDVEGTTIAYVVTKKGSSTSDKAQLLGIAQDYDPEYYIDNQVIPATMKILKELGVNVEELVGQGKQKRLL